MTSKTETSKRNKMMKKNKENDTELSQELEVIPVSKREYNSIKRLANQVESDEYIVEIAGTDAVLDDTIIKQSCGKESVEDSPPASVIQENQDEDDVTADEAVFVFTPQITGWDNTLNYSFDDTEHIQRKWKNEDKIGLLLIHDVFDYYYLAPLLATWKDYLSADAKVVVFGSDKPGPAKALKEAVSDGGNFKMHKKLSKTAIISIDDCVHHWLINSNEVGQCRFCGRKRNFRKLMKRSSSRRVTRKKKV